MDNIKRVEVLSPAGNKESFIAACQNGANAVYMGIDKFNARDMATNFSVDEYIECINYAHMRNIKVYLTLNILLYDEEVKEALDIVLRLYSKGLDAVIVQDIGLASLIHEMMPNLSLHASTQMSVYSLEQVKVLEKLGFKRVVLARELSLEEIKYICDNTKLEVEVFTHGALCVSVSGQCLLSSVIGHRSANRGKCAQPCRLKYSLFNSNNEIIEKNRYLLSKKDIYALDNISKLINAGVSSLKLEGRNKSSEYVAIVTNKYRKYVDKYYNNEKLDVEDIDKYELEQMFNRSGISSGYLNGVKYKNSITLLSPKNTGRFLGKVLDQKGVYVKLKLEENISLHDGFEIYSDGKVLSNIVTCIKNNSNKVINNEMLKGDIVWIGDVNKKVKYGSSIYKTSSFKLNKRFRNTFINNIQNVKNDVDIKLFIKKDSNITCDIYANNKCKNICFEYIPDIAKTKSLDKEVILLNFNKTLDTPFNLSISYIDIDDGLFIPVSKLNELRRYIISNIEDMYLVNINVSKEASKLEDLLEKNQAISVKEQVFLNGKKDNLYIYSYDLNKNYIDIYYNNYNKKLNTLYLNIEDYIKYKNDIIDKYTKNNIDIVLNIGNVCFENKDKLIKSILKNENEFEFILKNGVKGFLLGSLAYIDILNNLKKKYKFYIIADYTLNVTNIYSACKYLSLGFDVITPGHDMRYDDIYSMSKKLPIEIVKDYITVMTSRYCMIGSFIANRKENEKCSMPCLKNKFYIKDSYDNRYDIVCDNIDCIMKIVDKKDNDIEKIDIIENENECKVFSIRRCDI